jgi:hypothetical protein
MVRMQRIGTWLLVEDSMVTFTAFTVATGASATGRRKHRNSLLWQW